MGKVRPNGYTREFRGRVGCHVWTRRSNGEISVSMRPDRSNVVPSEAQELTRSRFRRVVARVRKLREADPAKWAEWEALARENKQSAFAFAVAELFKHPFVDEIDLGAYHGQAGDTIGIVAAPSVGVASVRVSLRDATTHAEIEAGAAVRATEDWVYTASTTLADEQSVEIVVTAKDRLGNETPETVMYP